MESISSRVGSIADVSSSGSAMRSVRGTVDGSMGSIADTSAHSVDVVSNSVGGARDNTPGAGLGVVAAGGSVRVSVHGCGGRVGVHGRGGVVRGRVVGHGRRLARGRVGGRASSRIHRSGVIARSSGGIVAVRLDNNGLNLLGNNSACRATVLVSTVTVDGSVLVALLAPAPAQETGQNGSGKGSEDNTGNGSARDVCVSHDGIAARGGFNKRGGACGVRATIASGGRSRKGLGALAGTVLVGVTVWVLQIG